MGEQICATAASDYALGETRYTEAEALEAGDSLESNGCRYGAASPDFTMRQVWIRNGLCVDAVGVPRSSDERVGSQTTCCGGSSGGRSRRSTTESASSDGQRLVIGQVCHRCHDEKGNISDRTANSCLRPCAATPSDRSHSCTQSATSIESSEHKGFSRDICDNATSRSVDHDPKVPLPRRCSERSQEYAYSRNVTKPCSRPMRRTIFGSYDGYTTPDNTDGSPIETYESSHPSQAKASCALPHDRESSVGLDGSLEEAESSRPRTVSRRRTRREKPPGQVASRIRELELKNAIPMPKHFRPAGHTRHDHDHDSGNHRSQLHRDQKPDVDLIFPLRVRRFPRRGADGNPIRPETPLHRSVPEEEPYIHSPQPARSMPMLKDPSDHDLHPTPKPNLDTSSGKHEEEPHVNTPKPAQSMPTLRDPLEHDSHLPSISGTLDTSRGTQDGFAVASGYGRRASRKFNVRHNSRS
jgi:hypothetical protein